MRVLKANLGSAWYQLGRAMGLSRGHIHAIEVKHYDNLLMQVDDFLRTFSFPSFGNDQETADFIVEALVTASLPNIAMAVKRDLESKLGLEGTQFFCIYAPLSCPFTVSICFTSLFFARHWINCMLLSRSGKMCVSLPLHFSKYRRL